MSTVTLKNGTEEKVVFVNLIRSLLGKLIENKDHIAVHELFQLSQDSQYPNVTQARALKEFALINDCLGAPSGYSVDDYIGNVVLSVVINCRAVDDLDDLAIINPAMGPLPTKK